MITESSPYGKRGFDFDRLDRADQSDRKKVDNLVV
jgi:hypothetical protein